MSRIARPWFWAIQDAVMEEVGRLTAPIPTAIFLYYAKKRRETMISGGL